MITLYTTGCPMCKMLENKLNKKNIEYGTCTDVEYMTSIGIKNAPTLQVGDKYFTFKEAMKWADGE